MSSFEAQVGDILWLPRRDQLPPDSLGLKPSNAARLQGGVFDHPVVIVDRRAHVVVIHIVRGLSHPSMRFTSRPYRWRHR